MKRSKPRNIRKLRWRADLLYGLKAILRWLPTLTPEERSALFGAIEDDWCISCGTAQNDCKCRGLGLKPTGT